MSETILNFTRVDGVSDKPVRRDRHNTKPVPKTPQMPSDVEVLKKMDVDDLNVLKFVVTYPELSGSAAAMNPYDRQIYQSVHQRTPGELTTEQKRDIYLIDAAIEYRRSLVRETNIEEQRKQLENDKQARKTWCETGDNIERFTKFFSEISKWNWAHADTGDLTKIAIPKMKALISEYKLEKIFK